MAADRQRRNVLPDYSEGINKGRQDSVLPSLSLVPLFASLVSDNLRYSDSASLVLEEASIFEDALGCERRVVSSYI